MINEQQENPSIIEVLKLTSPENGSNKKLLSLAQRFNRISGSDRPLIGDFYDCGTNARAIFLDLIHFNRGDDLCQDEEEYIFHSYRPKPGKNMEKLEAAKQKLKEMNDGVMILSLRFWYDPNLRRQEDDWMDNGPSRILRFPKELTQFGHVWVIEKRDGKYYLYQSCLNEFSTIDYYMKYGANLNSGARFLEGLRSLMNMRTWASEGNKLFRKYFDFYPRTIELGTKIRPEFFWSAIEYV